MCPKNLATPHWNWTSVTNKDMLSWVRDRPEIPQVLSVSPKEKQLQTSPPVFTSSKTSDFSWIPSPPLFSTSKTLS